MDITTCIRLRSETNVRGNCTWGSYLKLFAAAILYQKDIWVFISDIGEPLVKFENWSYFKLLYFLRKDRSAYITLDLSTSRELI